jgi:CRISPR/Cas system-associated exonuclease Cas4 (RecB family)
MVKPKTLSASSLEVARLCMKRFVHMNLNFAGGIQNNAAMTGSTCHYALEHFVKRVYIDKSHEPSLDMLIDLLKEGYLTVFGDADYNSDEYLDAKQMIEAWYKNPNFSDFTGRTVQSVEFKRRYPMPLPDGSGGTIPITYIWDRQDLLDDGTIVVVDYKSNRANVGTDELRKKMQPKLYALIAQILNPTATKIRVEYHMLRHDLVSVEFTPQDNANTWAWLQGEIQRILDTPIDPKPTLNKECGFCMMKSTCPEMTKNINNGGVFGLSPAELVDRKALLELQAKAAKEAALEIENILGPILSEDDGPNFIEGDKYTASLEAKRVRNVDSEMFLAMLGSLGDPDVIGDYTPTGKVTMALYDSLVKDTRIDLDTRRKFKQLITYITRDPGIKMEEK